jgi:hypothetical protein
MHMMVLAGIVLTLALLPLVLAFLLVRDFWYLFLLDALVALALGWWVLRYAIYFQQMRYELAPDGLHLRYGPLLHYHIPYDSIQQVWIHEFPYPPNVRRVSSPGLQLYGAYYRDMGKVFMCATANRGRVLLIKTDNRTYGITPQDEQAFIDALRTHTGERASYRPAE